MVNWKKLTQELERRGYLVHFFSTAQEAADYLDSQINDTTVGLGGSMTLREMGLYDRLASHNQAIWHWENGALAQAATAEVYLTSANGVAETGEIINIDGVGNRLAGTLFGHEKVYFVIGRNKLAPDYEKAVWRARNVAGPHRAQQLGKKTPCAVKADRCYDCKSPDRVCNAMVTLWGPMTGMETEILLVDEDLGL